MRYWLRALVGVVVCSAAAVAVVWATWALTRTSTCVAGDDTLACRWSSGQLAGAIAVALLVAIPLGSKLFKHRTAPPSGPLGPLAAGLAVTGAGVAALVSGITVGSAHGSAMGAGIAVGTVLLCLGPWLLVFGPAAALQGPRPRQRPSAAVVAASASPDESGRSGGTAQTAALGTLAAQLSAIADARRRTGTDPLAARLRQLDDLRASGLLSAEEHAQRRRALLDEL
jgi:hypothetical protein